MKQKSYFLSFQYDMAKLKMADVNGEQMLVQKRRYLHFSVVPVAF